MKTNTETPQTITSAISTTGFLLEASKKEVKAAAANAVQNVPDPASAFAMAKRLAEFAAAVQAEVKPILSEEISEGEKIQAVGCTLYFKGGGFRFTSPKSYEHDPVWQDLKAALDAREELMRTAAKQPKGEVLYDSDGAEVPRAIEQAVSPSLMCDF